MKLTADAPATRSEAITRIAAQLRADGMACNCDLDNWQPEPVSGHSWVCRIHKDATRRFNDAMKGGAL